MTQVDFYILASDSDDARLLLACKIVDKATQLDHHVYIHSTSDDEARKLDAKLQPLHKAMFLESNPIPVKWAAARIGLIPDGIRLPLVPLSKQFHGPVLEALQAAGIGFA